MKIPIQLIQQDDIRYRAPWCGTPFLPQLGRGPNVLDQLRKSMGDLVISASPKPQIVAVFVGWIVAFLERPVPKVEDLERR